MLFLCFQTFHHILSHFPLKELLWEVDILNLQQQYSNLKGAYFTRRNYPSTSIASKSVIKQSRLTKH